MRRRISGVLYGVLAVVFAVAAAYLSYFVFSQLSFLGCALVLVFLLGSAVSVRSARDAFRGSTNRLRSG
jgi:cobalamin biosynthesis protein CobD/CbiB